MKKASRLISMLLIVIMMLSMIPAAVAEHSVGAVEEELKLINSSTTQAPEGYVPENVYLDETVLMVEQGKPETPRVLLVEDVLPWKSTANQTVLGQLTEYDKVTTSEFLQVDLSAYGVIVFANDQPFATYENYKAFKEYMELFASIGGVIVFGACDAGWSGGNLVEKLPGDVTKTTHYVYQNHIVDATHPIVTGALIDNVALTDDLLYHNYCSHVSFDEDSLPPATKIIVRENDTNRPTLVEYPLGKGRVIASGLTWEHSYAYGYSGPNFGARAMADMFKYAIRVSSIDVNDVHVLKDYYINISAHHIIVADYDENLIEGAKVVIDGEEFYTDKDGMVTYTENFGKVKTVTVTADNYRKSLAKYEIKAGHVQYVLLSKDKHDGKPFVTLVNDGKKHLDLRHIITRYKQGDGTQLTLELAGEWGMHPVGSFVLYQDGVTGVCAPRRLTKYNTTFSIAPGKVFKPGLPIYVKMVSTDGVESDPVELQIQIDPKIEPAQSVGYNGNINSITQFQVIPDQSTEIKEKDFVKFFPANFEIKGALLPVEVSEEEDPNTGILTYKFVIGFISYEKTKNLLNSKDEDGEWKSFKKMFEEAVDDRVPEDRRKTKKNEFLRKWCEGATLGSKWKSEMKFEGQAAGYAELQIDGNGQVVAFDGGILVEAGGKASIGKTWPTAIGPIYFEASLAANLKVNGPVIQFTAERGLGFDPEKITLSLSFPSITIEGGYGVRKVATIGLYGSADVKMGIIPEWKGSYKASAGISVYVIFLVNIKEDFAVTDEIQLWSLDTDAIYANGEMQIASRNYNANTSDWNGSNNSISLMSMFETKKEDGLWVLQNSVLPDTLPNLNAVGDDKVMIFQFDDPSIETGNHIKLMYSHYENNQWSDPLPVWESETSDYYFDTLVHEDELYLVWQKAGETLSETDPEVLLEKALSGSEICFAKWDKESNKFVNQQFVTDDSALDMLPKLAANGENVSVVWAKILDNNLTEGDNVIYQSDYNGSGFGAAATLCQAEAGVSELEAVYEDGTLQVVYIADNGSAYRVKNGSSAAIAMPSSSAASLISADSDFYWYCGSKICKYRAAEDLLETYEAEEAATNLKVVENNGKLSFVWHNNTVEEGYIKTVIIEDGVVSAPVTIYSAKGMTIKHFDTILNDDLSWDLVMNMEDSDDVTALGYINIQPETDLALTAAYANELEAESAEAMPIVYHVANNGETVISAFDLMITDNTGKEYVHNQVDCSIAPGKEQSFEEFIDVSLLNEITTFTVRVLTDDENSPENNTENFKLGYPDVSVSVTQYRMENKILVAAKVVNNSNTPANTAISITEDTVDGITLDMKNIGILDKETSFLYNYVINLDEVDFKDADSKYYYVQVDTLEEDRFESDNTYLVPVYRENTYEPSDEEPVEIEIIDVTGMEIEQGNLTLDLESEEKHFLSVKILPENATNPEVMWSCDHPEIIRVTDEGQVIPIAEGTAIVTATTYDGEYTDEISIKVCGEEILYTLRAGEVQNGTISVPEGDYAAGSEIAIGAVADNGYEFDRWVSSNGGTFDNANESSTIFTMPEEDTEISALFALQEPEEPENSDDGDDDDECELPWWMLLGGSGGKSYDDVTKSDWFYDDVDYVSDKGLMNGTSNDLFSPYENTSRAMVVTILYRMAGEPYVYGGSPFADVADGQWYTDAVIWAAENNIVDGYGNGAFGPNNSVTREQLAAILYRYAQFCGKNIAVGADLSGYADYAQISSWAKMAMAWANGERLINGRTETTIAPSATANRAELAAILHRYCERVR